MTSSSIINLNSIVFGIFFSLFSFNIIQRAWMQSDNHHRFEGILEFDPLCMQKYDAEGWQFRKIHQSSHAFLDWTKEKQRRFGIFQQREILR